MTERMQSTQEQSGGIIRRIVRHENAVLGLVLVVLVAAVAVLSKGLSIRPANVTNILVQSSMRGVASVGQAFVILTSGIDVSVGGMGLVCSVLGAGMMTESAQLNIIGYPMPIYVAIPITLLLGVAWGSLNGSLVAHVGVPALIVTLGMWQITQGVAFQISKGQSFGYQPESLLYFGKGIIAGVPVPIIMFIVVVAVAYFILNYTTYGKAVYAIGGNPLGAWLSGVNLKRTQFSVYLISGLLAALAGVIATARASAASMRTLTGLEIDSIASVAVGGISIMGGRGNLIGVVLGVVIIGVVNNAMSVLGAGAGEQKFVKGMIIIAAVAIDYIRSRRG
jgi:ribose/xylose/arabinose/galactoside ABC-type transport system permease subunit